MKHDGGINEGFAYTERSSHSLYRQAVSPWGVETKRETKCCEKAAVKI